MSESNTSRAQRIIDKFGGQTALAKAIGKGQTTVQYWSKTGSIPSRWQGKLLRLAHDRGINLTAGDFVEPVAKEVEVVNQATPLAPVARWSGILEVSEDVEIPCYVLDDGRRVISRTGVTYTLTGTKSGDFDGYLRGKSLSDYLPRDLRDQLVEFVIPGVKNKTVRGISAETFLEICRAFVKARDDRATLTEAQIQIAAKAAMFLSACAKIGLLALIDEATGYQYERAQDALKMKLKIYLEEEMRKWEKTFPDELWKEFARLTKWTGGVTLRPKYWGKLVMELVYEYLDKDVAEWLKKNAPKPRGGQNYHQWLSSQYGLKRLTEHIWMLIGIASTCTTMSEFRDRVAEKFGRQPVQLTLYLPPPSVSS